MSKKLTFEEMGMSVSAANQLRNEYGQSFDATICKYKYGNKTFSDEMVFIGYGQYNNANMPNIKVGDYSYDCAYVKMKYNDGCLTIYLDDMQIDILPKDD